ncbi:MAG: antitoxin PrlF [Paracoccaceae bacterium]|jgi:antitoxin PrlF
MNATVSEKGQITIPKKLREQLGLEPGVILSFSEDHGRLIAQKKTPEDAMEKWRGAGKLHFKGTSDEYLAMIRER